MAFEAQYRGVCSGCGEPFAPGELIERAGMTYEHAGVCPEQRPVKVGAVCPKCFIEKSLTGACGCDE
jgi:hypothetical protein